MNKDAALYIGADPLTFNDIALIKKTISVFGYVTILLDRKNRDAEFKEYFLNYSDRLDIIRHDMKELKIHDYQVVPIDETVQKTLNDNHIGTIVLNLDYQKSIRFRMMTILQEVCPNINIMLMSAADFIERHFMKTIMDSDSTVTMYKKYCSDYAFFKFKLKTMKKIALTGNLGCNQDVLVQAFRDRNFDVIDMDKDLTDVLNQPTIIKQISQELLRYSRAYYEQVFTDPREVDKSILLHLCNNDDRLQNTLSDLIFEHLQNIVAKKAIKTFANCLIFNFSLLHELELESLFDTIICVHAPEAFQKKNLIDRGFSLPYISELAKFQLPIDEKLDKADFVFYGDKPLDELRNNAIAFINSSLK